MYPFVLTALFYWVLYVQDMAVENSKSTTRTRGMHLTRLREKLPEEERAEMEKKLEQGDRRNSIEILQQEESTVSFQQPLDGVSPRRRKTTSVT